MIFVKFPSIPENIAFDELEFTKLALSLDNKPYTPYSPYATGHTTLYYYLILASFKIFGIKNFSLRFPSAIFGVLSVIAFFFLTKEIFKNNKAAFISTFILLSQRWFFNFARFGFEGTLLFFLETLSILFILKTINKNELLSPALAGVFTALAYNSYASGRIFPFFAFLIALSFFILGKIKLKQILTFLFFLIIFTLPLNIYFIKHPDIRAKQLIFLFDKNLNIQKKLEFFADNMKRYALMFYTKGDPNGRHNYPFKPALNPAMAIFFTIGVLLSLKNIRKKENMLFISWFIFSLVPALLTYPWENPNMLRVFNVLGPVAFFSTLAILELERKYKKIMPILILILTLSFVYELRTYFYYQRMVFKHSFEISISLEELVKRNEINLPSKTILIKY